LQTRTIPEIVFETNDLKGPKMGLFFFEGIRARLEIREAYSVSGKSEIRM